MNESTPSLPSRRDMLARSIFGAGIFTVATNSFTPACAGPSVNVRSAAGPHELPPLPYAQDALAPSISANTLGFHYGKHHKAYVDNLNNLLKDDAELSKLSLDALVQKTLGDAARAGIFNNAAQVWNHTFYWNSMRPDGGGAPKGRMLELVDASFGGYDRFKAAFAEAAKTQFGSGWAWLIEDGGKLAIAKTGNADTPMAHGKKCLLTCDVWEHAYYLDYQNKRPDYVAAFLDELVNWEFAEKNLG